MMAEKMLPRALERLAMIEAQAPVREAAALMSEPHTDLIVVCDGGDMVGVVTKTDIVGQIGRCMGAGCTARVDSIMTRDVAYCRAQEELLDIWSVMKERGLQRILILDDTGKPLGIICARDALQCLLSEAEKTNCFAITYPGGRLPLSRSDHRGSGAVDRRDALRRPNNYFGRRNDAAP